jgi:prolyl-tRNA editing enzyme YbaK/EbsC (Cys-tRNA(Pro) deacylase)
MLLREKKTNEFFLTVMSASEKFSWKNIKNIINSKNLTMATEDEVYEKTKCLPGYLIFRYFFIKV